MALQSSGAISLSDIQNEFGGNNPISLSEYYRGGSYVTDNNTGVPTSGGISIGNFYGTVRQFSHTITSNIQEADLNTILTSAGWNGSDPVDLTIVQGVWLWSDNTSVGGLTISSALNGLLTVTNYGKIIGKGGQGGEYGGLNGTAGGPALVNNATGVTFINASGAFIAGGGGGGGAGGQYFGARAGGGGGAGGGAAGRGTNDANQYSARGQGGAIGQAGTNGGSTWSTVGIGYGGGSGGGGGAGRATSINAQGAGGGGGGRILAGTGGAGGVNTSSTYWGIGGAGGSAGAAGGNNAAGKGAGGGGGWGAAGGNGSQGTGGAGGAAIYGTAIASMTNNGTIYGSQA